MHRAAAAAVYMRCSVSSWSVASPAAVKVAGENALPRLARFARSLACACFLRFMVANTSSCSPNTAGGVKCSTSTAGDALLDVSPRSCANLLLALGLLAS